MAWDVRRTYYYLVCFATLLMMIIGTVQVVEEAMDLALPPERYLEPPVEPPRRDRDALGPKNAQSTRRAERMRAQQRRNDLRGLLRSLAWVLIAAPVYVYHWRKVRKDEG